jgi:outer membrane protein OmpA-like peptidoglycan-associated protein
MRLTCLFTLLLFSSHAQSDTTVRVYFDVASWQPKNDPFRNLDTIRWERVIRLEGRTDTTGSRTYNRYLADFRVQSVKALLQRHPYFSVGQVVLTGEEDPYLLTYKYNPRKERCVVIELQARVQGRVIGADPVSPGKKPEPYNAITEKEPAAEKMPRTFHPDSVMVVGDVVILRNIEFLINETVVTLESYPEMEQLAKVMTDHPTMHIHISGHVCCTPAQSLSDQRALKIYNYLLSKGIAPERMTHKGYSNKVPNPEAKKDLFDQSHRRVEIRIVRE